MFELEINETIQRITRDVLQDRTVISLMEILEESRIPDRFKAFFETEARWWVYSESVARSRDRRFDFSHAELASLLSYLEGVQVRHARFERDDFLAVLDSAVKLTYNYLCRPQTTLKWYVFRGEPTKSIGETLLRMDAFVDYPYFRTVFTEWVERKKEERPTFDSISAREFERIIRRIDDQILLSCTIDDLLGIMTPLFDFIGKGEALSIPIEAMIVFFDDKNIRKLVDFLERERGHRSHVSRNSFVILMEELLSHSDDEPDTDFSSVYQDDTLDEVVRDHLEGGQGEPEQGVVREMVRLADESSEDEDDIVISAGATYPEMPHDEEDRWEEEKDLPLHPPAAAVVAPVAEEVDSHRADEPAVPGTFEIGDEPASSMRHPHDEEDSLFFDPPGDGGDPIFDLLIESTDEEPLIRPDLDEAEAKESEETEPESEPVPERDEPWKESLEEPVTSIAEAYDGTEQEEPGEEFHIVPVSEEDEAIEALLIGEEREPEEEEERPLLIHGFGAAGEELKEAFAEFERIKEANEAEEVAGKEAEAEEEEIKDEPAEEEEMEELIEEIFSDDETDEEVEEEFFVEEEPGTGLPVEEELMEERREEREEEKQEQEQEQEEESRPEPQEVPLKSGPDDVRNYIDAMLERKVVKKIFNRSRENYEETLNRLNESESWREASRILDEVFIRYDVDPYSRIAIRFTDCVYGRYLSPVQ